MSYNDDRAWRDFSDAFRTDGLPKILDSSLFLSIHSGDGKDFDVKQACELGAALLLDKPLLLVSPPGTRIPSRLRRAADQVVENWNPRDPSAQERLTSAIKAMTGQGEEGTP